MAFKADMKTTYEPSRVIQPIYTGGSISLNRNGDLLASTLGEEALLTNLNTGALLARIEGDGESLTTLGLTPNASHLVLCSRSLTLRTFALEETNYHSEIEAKLVRTIKPHTAPVVVIAFDGTSSLLATGGADGVIKVWDIRGGYSTHTFHGHSGVISALHFFQVDSQNAANSGKRKSRQRDDVEEETQSDATASFRLASGGEDGKVRIWDLHTRKTIATLDSHVSVVRSLEYSPEQKLLLSSSRDQTAMLWNSVTWQARTTIPVLETIETAGFLESGRFFFTGGETARLRIWITETGTELTEDQAAGAEIEGIVDVQYHDGLTFLLLAHADQTLTLRSIESLSKISLAPPQIAPLPVLRRISGTHDEVIDLAYVGGQRNHLALATNLEDLRIISLETAHSKAETSPPYFGADVAILKGHNDIIITIDTDWSGHWLATGAKDNTARLWRLDPDKNSYICYATFTGHAESIGAVALPNSEPVVGSKEYSRPLDHPPRFLITGSQDKTIKRWDISTNTGQNPRAAYTKKAHDKDINAIDTSYGTTCSLFASASQDRTVKIWDVESGEALGVLRGHKRGVWTIAFSPSGLPPLTTTSDGGGASTLKGMVLTGSGDKTVKIWSLTDYSCLRTFEGHANSVLKVVWLPPPANKDQSRGAVQVASAAGDGLVKVWDVSNSECAVTLDNHIDRVWALAVKPPLASTKQEFGMDAGSAAESQDHPAAVSARIELVSGSADSTLTFWTDTTATTALRAATQATARIEQDQRLQNHIRENNFREAIVLAIQLNHPKRLFELFKNTVDAEQHDTGSLTGKLEVDEVLGTLSEGQLWSLLRRLRDWNANGRTHHIAQRILFAILRLYSKDKLLALNRRKKLATATDLGDAELPDAIADLSTKEQVRSKESVKTVLDGLKAYTEKHAQRLEKTAEERFVLLWTLGQMDDVSALKGVSETNAHEDVLMLNNI